ncbi:MAG: hypothetical protein VX633_07070, partial [Verrucomicrobiota bacterium]|nr:hypothetical protein [Verrucomicrobiota bacterium]
MSFRFWLNAPVWVLAGLLFMEPLAAEEEEPAARRGLAAFLGELFSPLSGKERKASRVAREKEPRRGSQFKGMTAREWSRKPGDLDAAVRLQIYLDEKKFGPGYIDGKPGRFTTKAVHSYNRSVGRLPDDWAAIIAEANEEVTETYAVAIVPDAAEAWVNPEL